MVSGAPSAPAPSDLETRFYPRNGSRIYEIKTELPSGEFANKVLYSVNINEILNCRFEMQSMRFAVEIHCRK